MKSLNTGDVVTGPYLIARNSATSGIHSDEFAQRQGFARAIVAAPNHLSFVSTSIEERLGPAWLERGRLRARFTAPVYDQDRVRAVLTVTGEGESFAATFQLEKADATVVATGSASWSETGGEQRGFAPSSEETELLDLRALADGERVPAERVIAGGEAVERFCLQNHDHLARPERVPAPYLSPLLFNPARHFMTERGIGPGMWGEIDIRQHQRVLPDRPYRYVGIVRSRRRRGNLEIVGFDFAAHDESSALVCEIAHWHLIPHRDQAV